MNCGMGKKSDVFWTSAQPIFSLRGKPSWLIFKFPLLEPELLRPQSNPMFGLSTTLVYDIVYFIFISECRPNLSGVTILLSWLTKIHATKRCPSSQKYNLLQKSRQYFNKIKMKSSTFLNMTWGNPFV